ncbi:hypothetical protein [Sphaerothrix gracilis]|uniref:VMAP-C domain-containing protein n=1 Tax=Sphaerothrix gracilis TaxID=3151835 RepID=UPI0031FBAEA1
MSERNLKLEYWQARLADLEQRSKELELEIGGTVDSSVRRGLEKKLLSVLDEVDSVRDTISEIEQTIQYGTVRARDRALLAILQASSDQIVVMQQAYQTTVLHWQADVPQAVESPEAMVCELNRIGLTADYSALEEFVAHLVSKLDSKADNTGLITSLTQWGQQYYPERNWLALRTQIQNKFEKKSTAFQPAILIRIRLDEETTTQSTDNISHYCLEAWLVEDVKTYQEQGSQRTGYHTLVEADTPAAAPFVLEELDAKIQPLLEQWLIQAKQILINCKKAPEFYIFLPKKLLDLKVDYWPLDPPKPPNRPKRLGFLYRVVLCCADRLEGVYPVDRWHSFWQRHQDSLGRKASDMFVDGSDRDLDALIEILEEAFETNSALGLKITTALRIPTAEDLFEELLISGLPLAIWGRCDEPLISRVTELGTILQTDVLDKLPETVQTKRRQARISSNTPECHIGHHLSLLRDDPTLIPPKSA